MNREPMYNAYQHRMNRSRAQIVTRREVTRPYTPEIIAAELSLRAAGDAKILLANQARVTGIEPTEAELAAAYDRHRAALEHLASIKYYQE